VLKNRAYTSRVPSACQAVQATVKLPAASIATAGSPTGAEPPSTRNSSPSAMPFQPNRRAKIPVWVGSALLLDQTTTKLWPASQAT